ncbi:MAG TPA: PaaI family thioesterase [Syntrophales bacterium]|nr:PaaI family thioesterase [Syntrophales bacterium]
MADKAFQDYYLDEFAHCYGCGRLNQEGMQIKSYWDGNEAVCHYTPKPYHTGGVPGFAYGGLIASLIDCHGAATASAAKLRADGYALGERPLSRFVAASVKVDFLKPTPIGAILELRARVTEIKGRRVTVSVTLSANGVVCAKGEEIFVQLQDQWSVQTGYPKPLD